jgi:EAL domain-containing protein (putative c-di-GMP-specific phosphodiesterase class I)/CheY-like chemotaxis protein
MSESAVERAPEADTPAPVLVVDADPSVRARLITVLRAAGLETREAADGEEALRRVAAGPVGAVVLDAHLTGMSGVATLRALRARPETSTLPVVLVTDPGQNGDRQLSGLDAGADDELTKPVDPEELVARVRALLRAQAAWSEVVEGHRRERAALAGVLRDAALARTPEATAEVLCAHLTGLPGIGGVAVVAFPGEDQGITLAGRGAPLNGLQAGSRLSHTLARRLREKGVPGPWIEPRAGRRPDVVLMPAALREELPAAAYVPVHGVPGPDGAVQGLLIVTPDDSAAAEDADRALSRCLAAAIDFGAVADALLAPALAQRGELALQRSALLRSLDARTFSPVFQPIVDLTSGETVGYELLTRFDDGAAPERRFAEAAAVGMGVALERATMAIGVAAAVTLPEDAFLSLNVSPSFLLERTGVAVAELARACERRLVLEITEHDPIEDYGAVLSAIADLGVEVQLSVDDAGAGYASLAHILALRPAFVKLDQGWITGIAADPARQALVAGLCHFARRTGCRLIAEGVEREAELAVLRELGVSLGQGFLLGRPAPVPLPA